MVGEKIIAQVQISPGYHLASCAMVTEIFPVVKRMGRGVNHPNPSRADLKKLKS
jgi:hypothetical protein